MMIDSRTVNRDSKSRKIRNKIEIEMIVDSICAVYFIIWGKKIIVFFGGGDRVVVGVSGKE
jgi:hypothetical protein